MDSDGTEFRYSLKHLPVFLGPINKCPQEEARCLRPMTVRINFSYHLSFPLPGYTHDADISSSFFHSFFLILPSLLFGGLSLVRDLPGEIEPGSVSLSQLFFIQPQDQNKEVFGFLPELPLFFNSFSLFLLFIEKKKKKKR